MRKNPTNSFFTALLCVAAVTLIGMASQQQDDDPGGFNSAAYRWQNRPVIMFAPTADDSRYARRQKAFQSRRDNLAERDVVRISVFETNGGRAGEKRLSERAARSLRTAFGIPDKAFAVVLVGKDGTEKRRWPQPFGPDELDAIIDAMPMRREEMKSQ